MRRKQSAFPANPISRKTLRRPTRSDRDPQSMNDGTEEMLVAAAMIPTSDRLPPRPYAKSGISADVAAHVPRCIWQLRRPSEIEQQGHGDCKQQDDEQRQGPVLVENETVGRVDRTAVRTVNC